jgi:hypothetical protein
LTFVGAHGEDADMPIAPGGTRLCKAARGARLAACELGCVIVLSVLGGCYRPTECSRARDKEAAAWRAYADDCRDAYRTMRFGEDVYEEKCSAATTMAQDAFDGKVPVLLVLGAPQGTAVPSCKELSCSDITTQKASELGRVYQRARASDRDRAKICREPAFRDPPRGVEREPGR